MRDKREICTVVRSFKTKISGPRVFESFKCYVEEKKEFRDLADRADRYRAINLLSNALFVLQEYSAERKSKRLMMLEAAASYSRESLRSFWAACTRKYYEVKANKSLDEVSLFCQIFRFSVREKIEACYRDIYASSYSMEGVHIQRKGEAFLCVASCY
jgi:hypothetical protein